jgi:hypothetical protein
MIGVLDLELDTPVPFDLLPSQLMTMSTASLA